MLQSQNFLGALAPIMVVLDRVAFLRQAVQVGRVCTAHCSFNSATGCEKIKVLVHHAVNPVCGSHAVMHTLDYVKAACGKLQVTDRGHKHSSGTTEVCFYIRQHAKSNSQAAPTAHSLSADDALSGFRGEQDSSITAARVQDAEESEDKQCLAAELVRSDISLADFRAWHIKCAQEAVDAEQYEYASESLHQWLRSADEEASAWANQAALLLDAVCARLVSPAHGCLAATDVAATAAEVKDAEDNEDKESLEAELTRSDISIAEFRAWHIRCARQAIDDNHYDYAADNLHQWLRSANPRSSPWAYQAQQLLDAISKWP
jgi:hypothetical protein